MTKAKLSENDHSTNTCCPFPPCNFALSLKAPAWVQSDQRERSAILPGQKRSFLLCYRSPDTRPGASYTCPRGPDCLLVLNHLPETVAKASVVLTTFSRLSKGQQVGYEQCRAGYLQQG